MRMWLVPTKYLCNKHLLGEHGEIHKHRHNFVKKHSIKGRIGQIEPISMGIRHDELAIEMSSRGMNHQSPYEMPDLSHLTDELDWRVDIEHSMRDLKQRCVGCGERMRANIIIENRGGEIFIYFT